MSLPDLPAADRVCDVCDHVYHCGGGHCSDRAFVEADWHRLERAEKRIAELEGERNQLQRELLEALRDEEALRARVKVLEAAIRDYLEICGHDCYPGCVEDGVPIIGCGEEGLCKALHADKDSD